LSTRDWSAATTSGVSWSVAWVSKPASTSRDVAAITIAGSIIPAPASGAGAAIPSVGAAIPSSSIAPPPIAACSSDAL